MKKYKFLALLLMIQVMSFAQNQAVYTNLSEEVFDEIKFNNVLFTSIISTYGDTNSMHQLFPIQTSTDQLSDANELSIEQFGQEIGEERKRFTYNNLGLKVFFGKTNNSSTFEVLDLVANSITIDDVTLEIGDNINELGIDYQISPGIKNSKYVSLVRDGAYCCPITITLNQNDDVLKIHYYETP